MGLFNFLKNGITLEKKKVQVAEPEPTEVDDTTEEETIETNQIATPEAEQPTMPMFSSQPTIEDQRMEAASVLLGDNGLTGGSTPSLIQIAQQAPKPAPVPQPTAAPQTNTEPQPQIFNTHNNVSGNFNNALLGQVSANQNLLVIAPQNSAEISTILTNLANGNACIVSLSKFSIPEAQRFLDYICGFVNAISGMIMQRSSNEFILTPKGVNIKNS